LFVGGIPKPSHVRLGISGKRKGLTYTTIPFKHRSMTIKIVWPENFIRSFGTVGRKFFYFSSLMTQSSRPNFNILA
jgi:hypothetical protein